MTVAELRARLAELENQGHGGCRVEVMPAAPEGIIDSAVPVESSPLDFEMWDYGVVGVDVLPWQVGRAVTLNFDQVEATAVPGWC